MTRHIVFVLSLSLLVPALVGVGSPSPAAAHEGERTKEELKALKKVMKTWAKALGVKCRYCHNPKNFKEWSPHKRIAHAMSDVFLKNLKHPSGTGEVHCKDCHSGKTVPDEAKLKAFAVADLKKLAPEFVKEAEKAPEAKAKEELKEIAEFLEKLK